MILTVYGRFFRLYMYTALAPLPLASFAGESTQSVGISFIKSYVGVCLEGAVIVLAVCHLRRFCQHAHSFRRRGNHNGVELSDRNYLQYACAGRLIKGSDRIIHEMMGL